MVLKKEMSELTKYRIGQKRAKVLRKRGLLKKPRGKYININPLMGYDWAHYIYMGGTGGVGKSYSSLNWLLNRKYKNPEHVHLYIVRLTENQCKKLLCDNAKTLIDPDLYRKYGYDLRTRGETVYYGKIEEHTTKTGKTQIQFKRHGELCRVINCSTCFNTKGNGIYDNQMPETDEIYLLFDEAVRDKDGGEMDRFSIVDNFTNQLETLLRSFHGKWKVIFCANAVGNPEILAHWNFIPTKPGIYKIKDRPGKSKRGGIVIQIYEESEAFRKEERETSASYMFNSQSNRFASAISSDGAVIAKKQEVKERKPEYILAFRKSKEKWFVVNSGNVVTRYNGEKKQIYAMQQFIDECFNKEIVAAVQDMFNYRQLKFDNCSTYVMFSAELERLKKR